LGGFAYFAEAEPNPGGFLYFLFELGELRCNFIVDVIGYNGCGIGFFRLDSQMIDLGEWLFRLGIFFFGPTSWEDVVFII
jgi:hypothetical protein